MLTPDLWAYLINIADVYSIGMPYVTYSLIEDIEKTVYFQSIDTTI